MSNSDWQPGMCWASAYQAALHNATCKNGDWAKAHKFESGKDGRCVTCEAKEANANQVPKQG